MIEIFTFFLLMTLFLIFNIIINYIYFGALFEYQKDIEQRIIDKINELNEK